MSVGLDLLDTFNKQEGIVAYSALNEVYLETLLERAVLTLEKSDIENKDDFLTRLQNAGHEVMMEMSPKNKVGIDNTDSGSSAGTSFGGVSLQNGKACDTELAIVTLSPKLGVIDDYKKAREGGLIHHVQEPFNDAVFDICTYIPRTRIWYYVCQLHEQGGMPEYLIDGAGYESRLVVLDDNIAFVDNHGYFIDLYIYKYPSRI